MKHNELQKNCIPNNHIRNVLTEPVWEGTTETDWENKRGGNDEEMGKNTKERPYNIESAFTANTLGTHIYALG